MLILFVALLHVSGNSLAHTGLVTRRSLPTGVLQHVPGVPESALPDDLAAQLPQDTPAPPWHCRVEAVLWWHRASDAARGLLPAALRPGPPVTVGAFVRYLSTPVGPYSEVLASPYLVAGALRSRVLARVHVPFIAVDSLPSVHGGRAHWDLPKALASFDGTSATGTGWAVRATARPVGPWLPAYGRLASSQVSAEGEVRSATTWTRARARYARVDVDVSSDGDLAGWLLPGRHSGLVLRGRMVVGSASPDPSGTGR
jgi:hypothetical protein